MPTGDTIDELMLRWEASRQQGKALPLEDLCAECPHLADELRQRIRAVLAMERVLGVTDHDSGRTLAPSNSLVPLHPEHASLPSTPGYEIVRIIGEGGMGVVYEARQIALGRTVAIKMISGMRLRPKLL